VRTGGAALPASVRVGYRTLAVEAWAHEEADTAGECGRFDTENDRILIDTAYGAATVAETLIHEVLHACYALGHVSEQDSEERTVAILSTQLAQVIRDNPDLVAFLSESLSAG
jgi:hypothetical protein